MTIRQVRQGAVLQLGFDRVDRRNAITSAMYDALADGLEFAAATPEIRVVLLHGHLSVFTAGNDLADFLNNPPGGEDTAVFRFLGAISRFPKPLIAAVNGPAVGIGTTMLLHCDLVYAGEAASFSLPFTNLGICPEAGSSVLLPALAGYARAAEKLLFGEPFDVSEAREMGLVNKVLPELFSRSEEEIFDRLREPVGAATLSDALGVPTVAPVLDGAELAVTLRRTRAEHLTRLRTELSTGVPLLYVPYYFTRFHGIRTTSAVAEALGEELGF